MRDSYGNMNVNTEVLKPTYSAVLFNFTSIAATATDFFLIANPTGSNRLLRINFARVCATATTATSIDFFFIKRTTANTGGTTDITAVNVTKHETTDPDSVASVVSYTANPTMGTGSIIRAEHTFAGSTAAQLLHLDYTFGDRPGKSIVIAPGESFAVNFNGQAVPAGLNVFCNVEYTEEIYQYT